MQKRLRLAAGVFAMVAAAACQSKKSSDDALARELDSASGASSGLLPMGGGTDVVSAIERVPTPSSMKVVPELGAKQRTRIAVISPTPTVIRTVPQTVLNSNGDVKVGVDTTMSQIPVAAIPQQGSIGSGDHFPSPARHPEPRRGSEPGRRRGGYPSTGDIIRNAPFPINP
jgi:hypothetical protein